MSQIVQQSVNSQLSTGKDIFEDLNRGIKQLERNRFFYKDEELFDRKFDGAWIDNSSYFETRSYSN